MSGTARRYELKKMAGWACASCVSLTSSIEQSRCNEDSLMARFSGKAAALMLSGAGLAFLLVANLAAGQPAQMVNSRTANLTATSIPYIDAHTHIDQHDPEGAVQLLLNAMDKLNGARAFIQTEPYGPGNPGAWDAEMILPTVKKHSDRLAVLGGGGTLNPMIIEAAT